jgi:hypothetical protein
MSDSEEQEPLSEFSSTNQEIPVTFRVRGENNSFNSIERKVSPESEVTSSERTFNPVREPTRSTRVLSRSPLSEVVSIFFSPQSQTRSLNRNRVDFPSFEREVASPNSEGVRESKFSGRNRSRSSSEEREVTSPERSPSPPIWLRRRNESPPRQVKNFPPRIRQNSPQRGGNSPIRTRQNSPQRGAVSPDLGRRLPRGGLFGGITTLTDIERNFSERKISPSPVRKTPRIPNFRTKENKLSPRTRGEVPSIQNIPLEALEIIASFLGVSEQILLSLSSTDLNNYINVIPSDLSTKELTINQFTEYFASRPLANLTGINLLVSIGEDLEVLTPFLPRVKTLILKRVVPNMIGPGIKRDIGLYLGLDIGLLSNCTQLKNLTLEIEVLNIEALERCTNLKYLKIHAFRLNGDVTQLAKCKNLFQLNITNVERTTEILAAVSNLKKLEIISVEYIEMKEIPTLRNCSNLKKLSLKFIGKLENLNGIAECKKLEDFSLSFSTKIKEFKALTTCPNLKTLFIGRSNQETFFDFNDFSGLKHLETIHMKEMSLVANPSLVNLAALRKLILENVKVISLPLFPPVIYSGFGEKVSGIEIFHLLKTEVTAIEFLSNTEDLREVVFEHCHRLGNINFLNHCTKITKLKINECPIETFSFMNTLVNLEDFYTNTHFGEELGEEVFAFNNLNDIRNCTKLERLALINSNLSILNGIENLAELKEVDLSGNDALGVIVDLMYLPKLEILNLSKCEAIDNFEPLRACSGLKVLNLGYLNIDDLSPIGECKKLEHLNIKNCSNVDSLEPLANLKNLKVLNLNSCINIRGRLQSLVGCILLESLSLESFSMFQWSLLQIKNFISLKYLSIAYSNPSNLEEFLNNSPIQLKEIKMTNKKFLKKGNEWIEQKNSLL